uniref:Uncharacterized protein n=1 Tax=Steinernema glaseri TaxID=37863 RepID=A0A1I7YYE9_9BILA
MEDLVGLDFSVLRRMRGPDKILRVGVLESSPDATGCFRNLPERPCPRPGAQVEIISMVLQMLGWNWTMVG